jgi:hypothetical protein
MGASRLSCFLCMLARDADHQVAVKAHPELAKVWYEAEQKMRAVHDERREVFAKAIDKAIAEGRFEERVVIRKKFGKEKETIEKWLIGMNTPELRRAGGLVRKSGLNEAKKLRSQARKVAKKNLVEFQRLSKKAKELEERHREGDIIVPNRYLRPFLEFQVKKGKPWTVKDIITAAGLGEQLGITDKKKKIFVVRRVKDPKTGEIREVPVIPRMDKSVGEALINWAKDHDRKVLSYGKLAHRSALLLEAAGRAEGAEREHLLRVRSVVLDQVAAEGAELAGSHPFPTRHERIMLELPPTVRRR